MRFINFHHQSGALQDWKLEYWPADDRYRASLHFHWNWMGRGHWQSWGNEIASDVILTPNGLHEPHRPGE